MKTHSTIIPLLVITTLSFALSGCSSAPAIVRSGDRVEAGFTCRTADGGVAATTRPDSELGKEKRSPFYLPRKGPVTVTLTAGAHPVVPGKERVSFEDEIMRRLEPFLSGLKEGDSTEVELRAERYPSSSTTERPTRMALVRKRDKEQRVLRSDYVSRAGREPEVGQTQAMEQLLNGTVSEVNDKEVVIRTSPAQEDALNTPFGPVEVRETPRQYEFDIRAEVGRLVRVGGMAGRISDVDRERELFTIDFGHPFGGETLRCVVNVAGVESTASMAAAKDGKHGEKPETIAEQVPEAGKEKQPAASLDPKAEKLLNEGIDRMLLMSGQAGARSGDLVNAHFTLSLEDGSLVTTTRQEIARDPGTKRVSWYQEPSNFAARELVAGKQELLPGLGEALVGMKVGEKKRLELSPDKAFGPRDPQKTQQFPCSQSFPKSIRMPADEYVKRFSTFPVTGKEVQLLPYFKSRVTDVTEKDVALEFLAVDGSSFDEPFGSLGVSVTDGKVITTLKPLVGAAFPLKDGFGIVSATDGLTFTVDLNNPLAGKTVVLELEAVSVSAAATQDEAVEWVDDHDAGLARAKREGKPVFMILHADWCGWCKKTFSETIPDPRITAIKDRFVWVRVNSDKELKYKQQYGQEGFPMMVLLNSDGTVLKKIDGYRDAAALREEIRAVLN